MPSQPAAAVVAAPSSPVAKTLTAPQKALIKLGLVRPIDLALHLPLRYEDETRITPLKNAREGEMVQIEATVTACDIKQGPRRVMVVVVEEGKCRCEMGFFSF